MQVGTLNKLFPIYGVILRRSYQLFRDKDGHHPPERPGQRERREVLSVTGTRMFYLGYAKGLAIPAQPVPELDGQIPSRSRTRRYLEGALVGQVHWGS